MAFPRRLPTSSSSSRLAAASSSSSTVAATLSDLPSATATRRLSAIARHMTTSSPVSASATAKMEPSNDGSSSVVLTHGRGCTRTFILNRPKKVNALNPEMVDLLHVSIDSWSASRLSKILVGRGAGERAFCAGGDIKHIAELSANPATRPEAMDFFKREFELDWKLANYSVGDHAWDGSKVYVAMMNGVTMGGGAGLSFGGLIRIATEKTQFAMPETIIGYTPDVGATYYLNQLDGEVGTYLALTGNTVVGRGCLDLGLATHFVPSHLLDELHERFELTGDPDKYGGVQAVLSMVEDYEAQAPRLESAEERKRQGLPPIEWDAAEPNSPTRFVGAVREALDEAFSKSTVAAINDSLAKMVLADSAVHLASADAQKVSAWAKETLATMASRSQISMEVTLLGMRRAAKDGTDLAHKQRESKEELPPNAALKRAFEREYRAVEQFVHNASPDFPSGVIRKLVDKLPADFAQPTSSPTALAAQFYPADETPLRPATPALELLPPVHGFDKYPYRAFGLPSESEIRSLVDGEHKTSGDFKVSEETLRANFNVNRPGVGERIREIVARKCTATDEGWLTWKSDSDVKSWEQ